MSGVTLVTGASGTVGANVTAELVRRGAPVRAAVRDLAEPVPPGCDVVRFDFADAATWQAALDGVERMFLMRPPAISDTKRVIRPVVGAAARANVGHVAVLSVMGVNPMLPHWHVERDVAASGMGYTLLRPAFFMQNLTGPLAAEVRAGAIRQPAGSGKMSWIDARDIGEAAAVVLTNPTAHAGARYTLTGPEALGYAEAARIIGEATGRDVVYRPLGLRAFRRALLAEGLPADYVRVQLVINLTTRLGLAAKRTRTLGTLLGRRPRTLREFARDHAEAWRA